MKLELTQSDLVTRTADVPWQGDFSVDSDGRINLVEGDLAYVQRLLRRLLTGPRLVDEVSGVPIAPPDYIFEPAFGAGLRRVINTIISPLEVQRLITQQIKADPETVRSVPPRINLFQDKSGEVYCQIFAPRSPNGSIKFALNLSDLG